MYKRPCRRRLRLGATGTSLCEELPATEKSTGCETQSVVCVIPKLLENNVQELLQDNDLSGQLHFQVESCEQILEEPDITTKVLESR